MFKSVDRDQESLLPPSVRDLIPDDDLSLFVIKAVEKLDLRSLHQQYHRLGQNAYHPTMMLTLLFYAYCKGVFTARDIEERVRYDVRFMHITGNRRPDFRTIADFRKQNLPHLSGYFVEIMRWCMEQGLVPLVHIAIDGTKLKASASKKRMKTRKQIDAYLAEVEVEIAERLAKAQKTDDLEDGGDSENDDSPADESLNKLQATREKLQAAQSQLDADPGQQRINLTDLDCRDQKVVGPGYNGQIAVDCATQIIVAAEVIKAPNDVAQLLPLIDQAEANTRSQGQGKQVSADAGYGTLKALDGLQEKPHVEAYIPPQALFRQKDLPQPPYDKYSFVFDAAAETCICPQGHPMRRHTKGAIRGVKYFEFVGTACDNCAVKKLCTPSRFRRIRLTLADPLVKRMRRRLDSIKGKEMMRTRSMTVEPVFGQLKECLGFRGFRLRGLEKVRSEFALLCTAFNLRKIHKLCGNRGLPLFFSFSALLFCCFNHIFGLPKRLALFLRQQQHSPRLV